MPRQLDLMGQSNREKTAVMRELQIYIEVLLESLAE